MKQQIFSWIDKFTVKNEAEEDCYVIDGPGWEVKGSLLDHDYTITSEKGEIVKLHKVWLSWGDSYELEISDDADEVLALAVVIAIDCVMAAQEAAADSV